MKYREFTCAVCGVKAIDRSPAQKRLYCSGECNTRAYRERRGLILDLKTTCCTYNKEVLCLDDDCASCGWNPRVEQKRKEALAYG